MNCPRRDAHKVPGLQSVTLALNFDLKSALEHVPALMIWFSVCANTAVRSLSVLEHEVGIAVVFGFVLESQDGAKNREATPATGRQLLD
jgi:hypothetical protein